MPGVQIESSLIIPVFNKWDLTRECLKSVASTTPKDSVEVIVVDNASSDATQKLCPIYGRRLFGSNFQYVRNDQNRNFAGASNQGASLAAGEFLIFLNNDTEPQPGWYQPLLNDFSQYPDIAATGPLLLYPEDTPFGKLVQHLGVYVSPSLAVGHLYEGIPAASPLASRRRFFQIITAACMVMRKQEFLDAGGFDENFINGFEDVDICARLWAKGRRMTVNPASVVIHHESQTPGRHAHETENSELLKKKSLHLLVPDWHKHVKGDNLVAGVNEWLSYTPLIPEKNLQSLSRLKDVADSEHLRQLLCAYPYWEQGWQRLISASENINDKLALFRIYFKLFKNPDSAFAAWSLGKEAGETELANQGVSIMRHFADSPEAFLNGAKKAKELFAAFGMAGIADQNAAWIANYKNFVASSYRRFAINFSQLAEKENLPLNPMDPAAYAIWIHSRGEHSRKIGVPKSSSTAFSILMPVYNPDPEYFKAALDSVLAQDWDAWELCLVDDGCFDPEVREIMLEYSLKDDRVRIATHRRNSHISESSNTALAMARNPWCVLLDHDDLLAQDALAILHEAICKNPDGILFYSDEDKFIEGTGFIDPHFKNGSWDAELLASQNFVCHLAACRTDRLRQIGGFRKGFEGAQDYDMLLRYTKGADPSALIHIPEILYHWRVHSDSTSASLAAKDYAAERGIKASRAWLAQTSPGAIPEAVAGLSWPRIRYPVPASRPLASLITKIPGDAFDILSHARTLLKAGRYPCELVYVCGQNDKRHWEARIGRELDAPVRLVSSVNSNSGLAALHAAATQAAGEILGFLSPHIVCASFRWLEEIVSILWRDGIGAAGGALINQDDGTLVHAGYLFDGTGLPQKLLAGAPAATVCWNGWNALSRTVAALDAMCLFTKRETFSKFGGFDANMGDWAPQDYTLRLGKGGLRSIWHPYARLGIRHMEDQATPPMAFCNRWQDALAPFNKNLLITGKGFSLCTS